MKLLERSAELGDEAEYARGTAVLEAVAAQLGYEFASKLSNRSFNRAYCSDGYNFELLWSWMASQRWLRTLL